MCAFPPWPIPLIAASCVPSVPFVGRAERTVPVCHVQCRRGGCEPRVGREE